ASPLWHPPLDCLLRASPALRNARLQTFPLLGEDRDQDGYECGDNGTENGDDDLAHEPALLAQVPLDLLDTVLVGLCQVVDTLGDVVQLLGHRAHEAAVLGVCDTLSETWSDFVPETADLLADQVRQLVNVADFHRRRPW